MSFLDLYQGDVEQALKPQPNERPNIPTGFDENLHAAWSDGQLFSQSIAKQSARAAVLSDYIGEIRQKTGQDLSKEFMPDVAGGGQTGVTDFSTANDRVAAMKKDYPDLDLIPMSEDEINSRALAKSQAAHRTYEGLQAGEKGPGGSIGSFLGSAGSGVADPINILALPLAPAEGLGVLATALRWGAIAGGTQAAIEFGSDAYKEQVQPGYMESGAPLKEIGGAFVGGAVVGGSIKALGNAWTRVKTGQWPTSVRDAGNVIESEANVANTNPFPGTSGAVAHREALSKTIDDILAGRPVDVSGIINQQFLSDSRDLVQKLQTAEPGQPMALPVINQHAIELAAQHDMLTKRDAELASTLDNLPAGDLSAADRLNRLQAVEQQIAEATDPAAKRKLNERRDQILVDTNPEALQAAAAPIEARRAAEAERASIASRLDDITSEHANLQASTLPEMQLPALGQSERIPTGPKGQFEMDLQPQPERVASAAVKVNDKIYTGANHAEALQKAATELGTDIDHVHTKIDDNKESQLDAWVTSSGRFIDSKEAAKIVNSPHPKLDSLDEEFLRQKPPAGPQPALQTPEEMAKTLTAPDHQEAIRADIDRARATADLQVPGLDENGNHTMIGIDAEMDKVDAYRAAAEQIQACANPVQEAAE